MTLGEWNQTVIFESPSDSPGTGQIGLHRGPRKKKWRGARRVRIPLRAATGDDMSLINIEPSRANPLEVVERMASTNDWSFERAGEDEITLLVRGKWADYQVSFTWMYDIEALHLACAFEFKVPERWCGETQQLIAMINEQMWIGHFDLWVKDGLIMYRHALVLAGG